MAQVAELPPAAAAADVGLTPSPVLRADSLVGGMAIMLMLAVVQRGIGLFRNIMVCRLLEPDELGSWNLAYNFLRLAAPLVVWGIPGSFKRYLEYYRQRGQLRAFVRRSSLVTLTLSVIGLMIVLIARRPLAWLVFGSPQAAGLLCVCAWSLVVVIAFNFCVELLTSLRQVRLVSWLQLANSVIFTVSALLLLAAGGWRTEGVVLGYGVACGLTGLLAAALITWMIWGSSADDSSDGLSSFWVKLIPFAAWFWLSDLLTNLFAAVDRYMIVHFAQASGRDGLSLVGQYHSSRILGEVLIALTCMLGGVLLSYLSCDWEAGRRREVLRKLDLSMQLSSLALTAGAAVALLLAPVLFRSVWVNKYVEGLSVMPLTMVGCIWFGLLVLANNYLWCRERAGLASLAVGLGLVVNALLNYCWLPWWGLWGAVAATATANLATLTIVLLASHSLGMRYSRGTWVVIGLPLSLCLGGWVALGLVGLLVGLGFARGWPLTVAERDRVVRSLSTRLARLTRRGSVLG